MKRCNKCGSELNDNAKFCTKCGNPVSDNGEMNTVKDKEKYNANKKNSKVKVISIIVLIIIVVLGSIGVYYLKSKSENQKAKKSIEIQEINTKSYPKVSIIVKAKNINGDISSEDIGIKEGEYFPKDISVEKSEVDKYLISYSSSNSNAGKDLTVDLEYTNKEDSIKCSSSYTVPEPKDEKSNDSNVSLNTYDANVEEIKELYDDFTDLRTVYIQIFTLFKFDKNLKKYNRKTTLFIVK